MSVYSLYFSIQFPFPSKELSSTISYSLFFTLGDGVASQQLLDERQPGQLTVHQDTLTINLHTLRIASLSLINLMFILL